ncbi:MAG TPA: gliding motility protein GldN [Bacteroidia bacterium]|jgi:gliding motility associated protien GldN
MKAITGFIAALLLLCGSLTLSAQNVLNNKRPLDGPYVPEHLENRKPIPYSSLREADVMWSKRIWRVIDLREKMNLPLKFPDEKDQDLLDRQSLWMVIRKGVLDGSLTAYGNPVMDDEFQLELTPAQAQALMDTFEIKLVPNINDPNILDSTKVPLTTGTEDIVQYWLKEDWFFDKQRSVMDVRIIGIAPVKEGKDDAGEFRSFKPIFWLYFPACRNYFARHQVFNRQNDAEKRSFEDVFAKRLFSSYIKKEANVYNRYISQYATNIDALIESDNIKEKVFETEHDMWHF